MRTSTKNLSREEYKYLLSSKTPEHLIQECLRQFDRSNDLEKKLAEAICEKKALEASCDEMTKEFSKAKKELASSAEVIASLRKLVRHQSERISELNKLHFGSQSEQGVLDVILESEEDIAKDDIAGYVEVIMKDGSTVYVPKKNTGSTGKRTGKKGKRGRPKGSKNKINLDLLDVVVTYKYDFDAMDEKYGEGNYRIYSFRSTKRLKKVRSYLYLEEIRTPIYSVGLEHELVCPVSLTNPLLPKSCLDSSFVADFMCQHDVLCTPFYRQEKENARMGYPVPRSQLATWRIMFATGPFQFVYDQMKGYTMTNHMYHYDDESRWMIVMDGKNPGHMSWIWSHVSGLEPGQHPCVLYSLELTRSIDHLRMYYADFGMEKLYIICDGYVSYPCFAKENPGKVIICRDWMHVRRKFIAALDLLKGAKVSQDILVQTPEYKMVSLCDALFDLYDPLRDMEPEKRQPIAKKEIGPVVEKIFRFADFLIANGVVPIEEELSEDELIEQLLKELEEIEDAKKNGKKGGSASKQKAVEKAALKLSFTEASFEREKVMLAPPYSDALRIALGYISSEKTRESLSHFLEDGHILPDSSPAERSFKVIACDRKNSLFSYVQKGGVATCISHSLAESCIMNGGDPYYFFKYLCDRLVPLGEWKTKEETITLPNGTTKVKKERVWTPTPECYRRKDEFFPWAPEFFTYMEEEQHSVHAWCEAMSEEPPVIPKKKVASGQ